MQPIGVAGGGVVWAVRFDEGRVMPRVSNVRSQWAGVSALVFTVLLWGMSGVAIKATSTTGIVTALYRTWFAIPPLWATMLAPGLRSRLNGDWLRASLVGGALFCVHQMLYFTSLKLTSVANVTIIGALQPALVLLLAGRMFGESVTYRALMWAGVAFFGTMAVVLGAAHAATGSLLGDALATLNLFAFTAYFLASKRFRGRVGPWEYVVGMTTVSGVGMLVAALSTGQDLASPRGTDWIILLGIAIFPGSLGHALTNWAHAHVTAFVASMILLAVPVIAALGAFVCLGEAISGIQIGGGAVVLAAVAMIVVSAQRANQVALAESAAETDAP
jgi:drug/metabolite transporter (DMT)-like permease